MTRQQRPRAGHRGDDPRRPGAGRRPSCWPSCWSSRSPTSSGGAHELAAGYEERGPRLPAGARRRRLPPADPPRPDAVRRALPAPRPAGPAVGRGARDAGHRRLQAADLAGPDRLDPRRRPRRRAAHACRAAATSTPSATTPVPARRCCTARPPAFLEKLGLDRIDDLPPIAEFIPGADVVEALEAGLRVTDAPTA